MRDLSNLELTQETLIKLITYDKETGIFTWKPRPIKMFKPGKYQLNACNTWNSRFANKEAGYIWTPKKGKTSYMIIKVTLNGKKKDYKAHRLVFLYLEGEFPPESVDHIDGSGLNNKKNNLRKVSHQENMKNKPMRSDNTSGCVGVTWSKNHQKWRACINTNGKQINGGCFTNKDDAIAKRKELELEYDFHTNHGREQQ